MYQAPNLCGKRHGNSHSLCSSYGTEPKLHLAYAAWAEHHDSCVVCKHEDWYNPGYVQTVDNPRMADGSVKVGKKTIHYRAGPDTSVLCTDGEALFNRWCVSATKAIGAHFDTQ